MQKNEIQFIQNSSIHDFLSWLQREFLKRRQKNENYSIRAFANYLKISPATISHLLSGKRSPSVKFVESKLLNKLDASVIEKDLILASLRKAADSSVVQDRQHEYHLIAFDSFAVLSEWQHYAILEMTEMRDFKNDPAWIADQLNLSVPEVRAAIDRLLRLDLLFLQNENLVKTNSLLTNGDDHLTSSAHRQLQRHVLLKALDAIDEVPLEEKDISSMTMAIDVKKIPAAKKKITEFRRELCAYLEEGSQTRVYNLGIQLYPVSKKTKSKKGSI